MFRGKMHVLLKAAHAEGRLLLAAQENRISSLRQDSPPALLDDDQRRQDRILPRHGPINLNNWLQTCWGAPGAGRERWLTNGRDHLPQEMVSCVIEPSLQRVRGISSCGAHKSSDVIHGRRIGTSSLRKRAFLQAPPVQEPR
jgi:hypothetical protein